MQRGWGVCNRAGGYVTGLGGMRQGWGVRDGAGGYATGLGGTQRGWGVHDGAVAHDGAGPGGMEACDGV